jgi:hypothetical protein
VGLEIFITGTPPNPNLHISEIWKVCSLHDGEEMTACTEKRILSHLNPHHTFIKNYPLKYILPVPVAARSKAWVCGHSPAENVGSNLTGDMDDCLLWVFL